jgi:hypothetical protein
LREVSFGKENAMTNDIQLGNLCISSSFRTSGLSSECDPESRAFSTDALLDSCPGSKPAGAGVHAPCSSIQRWQKCPAVAPIG